MEPIETIVCVILALLFGIAVGAMWGLSKHKELLDWLPAQTITRWQDAMRSLGYEQQQIDMVLERMGQRIIPPYIPMPEPSPIEPSLDDRLRLLHICAAWHYTVAEEDKPLLQQLCINYAEQLHSAAKEGGDPDELDDIANRILAEWTGLSKHYYGIRTLHVEVNISHEEDGEIIYVLFDAGESYDGDSPKLKIKST